MLKKKFHDRLENFDCTRICMENHERVTGWQKLFFSYKCFKFLAAVSSLLLRYMAENSQVTYF